MDIKSKEDNERRERENLAKKLKEMESKILVGGVDLVDKNQVLEQQLRLQAQELETKAVCLFLVSFVNFDTARRS